MISHATSHKTTGKKTSEMRILLADDQALFLSGLEHLLASHGFNVVGSASDGLEALIKARALRPDVILMDIQMPGIGGLEATRRIKAEMPEIKIVMLTVSAEDKDLFAALRSGASGYLLKNLDGEELCQLLLRCGRGEAPLTPDLVARVLEDYARSSAQALKGSLSGDLAPVELTTRQREILALVAEGLTYKEIAAALHVTLSTVKYHMGELMRNMNVRNKAEAVAHAGRAWPGASPEAGPQLRIVS